MFSKIFLFEHHSNSSQVKTTAHTTIGVNMTIIKCFNLLILLAFALNRAESRLTCPTKFTYLANSKMCVYFESFSRLNVNANGRCLLHEYSYNLGRMANLFEIQESDYDVLKHLTQSRTTSVWTKDASWYNCTYVYLISGLVQTSVVGYDVPCYEEHPYFCALPSFDRELGMQSFLVSDLSMSSSSVLSETFEVIKHEAKHARYNLSFSNGVFSGAGWCSKTTNLNEYIEVHFKGNVMLTGLQVQHGVINKCHYWVTNFTVQYFKIDRWFDYAKNNSRVVFQSYAGVIWLEYGVSMKVMRVYPLAMNSSCAEHSSVFCMRLELYGVYTDYNTDFLVLSTQPTEPVRQMSWQWAIPKHREGCPTDSMASGYVFKRFSFSRFLHNSSLNLSTAGTVTKETACFTSSPADLPTANYCLYSRNKTCPDGFLNVPVDFGEMTFLVEHLVLTFNFGETYEEKFGENFTFCCRNNSISLNANHKFTQPFYLLPVYNVCATFNHTTVKKEFVEFRLYPNVTFPASSNLSPIVFLQSNQTSATLTAWFCLYEPENAADSLMILPTGVTTINTNLPFSYTVCLYSRGREVMHGVDAHLTVLVMILNGHGCETRTFTVKLEKACGSIPMSTCSSVENVVLKVSVNTTRGKLLENALMVKTYNDFNTLVLINEHANATGKLYIPWDDYRLGNFAVKEFVFAGINARRALYDALHESPKYQLHAILAIDPHEFLPTLMSTALAYDLPAIVFNRGQTPDNSDLTFINHIRYVTEPNIGGLKAVLLSEEFNIEIGVVMYRAHNYVRFVEFNELHRLNVPLLKDIVIENTLHDTDLEILASYPGCNVFVFLDSMQTSLLLTKAITHEFTPWDGYNWFSFSSNYVISNTFLRAECMLAIPPCHVAFKSMINIFHGENDCSLSANASYSLSRPVVNLAEFFYKEIMFTIVTDMISTTRFIMESSQSRNKPVTTENFLQILDSIECMPSGSGFTFTKPYANKPLYHWLCQPGWQGNACNIPICSISSCNQTHGSCVAPEVCFCNPGRYGQNCNGDCTTKCKNGVCNDGFLGDGSCKLCHWLYLGKYCDDYSIIYGFVAAGIGTSVVVLFVCMYIVRFFQTQEQSAEAAIEAAEKDYTMKWDDMEDLEDVNYTNKVAHKHLRKKLKYTAYKRGTTFSGREVFIKCYEKPYFELSLGLKTEIKKLCTLDHMNVEQMVGLIVGQPALGVVTEVASMGSLYDVLHEKNIPITWDVKYSMMQDICRGMTYLHEDIGIEHGRLKSTNCLLHQGWLVKLTDIGLRKLKSKEKTRTGEAVQGCRRVSLKRKQKNDGDEEDEDSDYSSLLWTAPEFICTGAKSLDQIIRITAYGDIYSFGIIMAEIASRRPPYSENTVMTISHIVKAVGHLKEPIVNLGQLNTVRKSGTGKNTTQNLQKMQSSLLRPDVEEALFPTDEAERSILIMLMQGCWSEEPEERPPFSYSLEVLELVTPLKGSQITKRALLLERETESLEQYIGHDTQQLFNEVAKWEDLLKRVLPPSIATEFSRGGYIEPVHYDNISVMVSRIVNLTEIIQRSTPQQTLGVVESVWKMYSMIEKTRQLNLLEINSSWDLHVIGSGLPIRNGDRHAAEVTTLALRSLAAIKLFRFPHISDCTLSLRIGIHTGPVTSGIVIIEGSPKYVVLGEAVVVAQAIEKDSRPNLIHVSKKTVSYLKQDFEVYARKTYKLSVGAQEYRTYWVNIR